MALDAALPERAAVYWRPPMDGARLRKRGRLWTLTTIAHVVPFVAAGVILFLVQPLAVAVSVASLGHAWIIPMLYAARGANVLRPRSRSGADAERTAVGLLGDLVGHDARELHARTGLVVERGALGVWVVGEAGAVLLTARGRRATCFCVRVADLDLPSADRIAHLLLALRADEVGFATVANMAFSGARWRVRRRLPAAMRPAIECAAALSGKEPLASSRDRTSPSGRAFGLDRV
ncbi:hypothetical protein [Baekduia sp.]|jgi:hypothetical protein|uniref:hypothetical protein n=1 Tax=Baekduia sp. TaxID=2600305 RepID=UPI002DFB4EE8|nr:hypothetical protein [Baekduia sp.]